MKILNWTHHYYFGPSLGAIASTALATEYISTFIEPVKVQVPPWYKEIWPVFVPEDYINPRLLNGDSIQRMGEYCRPYGHRHSGWLKSLVQYAGYHDHKMIPFIPKATLSCGINSKNVLIYPREHANKNGTYTIDYWTEVCKRLQERGYKIIAVLHDKDGHRDNISLNWSNKLKSKVDFEKVYPSTIPNLFEAISQCELSIGVMTGPSWLCLKSNIRQVVLSSHIDEPNESTARAETNLQYFAKPVDCIIGTNLDWINSI